MAQTSFTESDGKGDQTSGEIGVVLGRTRVGRVVCGVTEKMTVKQEVTAFPDSTEPRQMSRELLKTFSFRCSLGHGE